MATWMNDGTDYEVYDSWSVEKDKESSNWDGNSKGEDYAFDRNSDWFQRY